MWIKCLSQAVGESHTAVKCGFVVYPVLVSGSLPPSPAVLVPHPGIAWSWPGSKRPQCRRAERQEWRREMKPHKRFVSELEMSALAAVPCPEKLHSQK